MTYAKDIVNRHNVLDTSRFNLQTLSENVKKITNFRTINYGGKSLKYNKKYDSIMKFRNAVEKTTKLIRFNIFYN